MTSTGSDWLAQLAPAHVPGAALMWWPPAAGWWGLVVLLVLAGAASSWWSGLPENRQRRLALREFRHLRTAQDIDDQQLARQLEHLLRRYALVRHGRETVARLTGRHWIEFVIAHGGAAWNLACGDAFLRAAYGGHPDLESGNREQWLAGVEGFLRCRQRAVSPLDIEKRKIPPLGQEGAQRIVRRTGLKRSSKRQA